MTRHTRTRTTSTRSRRGKIMAILAGGAVIGLGTTATLAAWTDTEWVFGGNADGTGPGVGTSAFEVEQNVDAAVTDAGFVQDETNPGQSLTFGTAALSLAPGDSVFAPVALRTVTDSVAGALTLEPAVAAAGITAVDADGLLWSALDVRVWVSETAFTCDATTSAATADLVTEGALSAPAAATTQQLGASGANIQHYCVEITLPEPTTAQEIIDMAALQGRTVAPAWEFSAVSV